jgi:DNA-binding winged helix-turn-helix (wHTH) protein
MSYQFLDFDLDPARYQLCRAGTPLEVPPQIFDLILLLIRHRDRPVPKSEILSSIWRGRAVTEASLTHAIAHARKLLGDTRSAQSIIKTVHGRGYWWVVETREKQLPVLATPMPFAGRELELNELKMRLDEAHRGSGAVVIVVGEPGAGKTRLLERFYSQAEQQGAICVRACAEDLQPTPPFYVWRQVVRQLGSLSRGVVSDRLELLAEEGATTRDDLSSSLLDAEASLESAAARAALYDGLVSLLSNSTGGRPLVLVLEDIHRADVASLQALIHICPSLSKTTVLVVATQRPAPMAEERPRVELARLGRVSNASTILLPSLSREDIRAFLIQLGDPRVPVASLDLVFEASGGNPFLLWQIVGIARSRAGLRNPADLTNLPTVARAAIALHIAELPADSAETLRIAAVLGSSFDSAVLARVANLPAHRISRLLSVAEQAGLIRSARFGRVEFVHDLLREALYEEMDLHTRAELHLESGSAMLEILGADSGDHLPAIALHFREARMVGGREKAAELLERCGLVALRDLAFADAAQYLADALAICREGNAPDIEAEIRILLALGASKLCVGDREGARTVLLEAADLSATHGRTKSLAEAALRMAPSVLSLEVGVVDPLLISLLERALGAVRDGDEALKVELTGRLALALYWSDADDRRKELVRQLRAMQPVDPERRVRGLLFALGADWGPDSLEDRVSVLETLREGFGYPRGPLKSVARVFMASTCLEIGDLEGMKRACSAMEAELATLDDPYGAWYPRMFKACQALSRGEFDQAVALAREYSEIGRRFGDANVTHAFAAHVAETLWLRGGAGIALGGVEELADQHPNMPEWRAVAVFFRTLCDPLFDAEYEVERLAHRGFSGLRRTINWPLGICSVVEVVVRRQLSKWAPPLFEILRPYQMRNAVAGFGVVSWGSMSRFLGQLAGVMGRIDEAQALVEAGLRSDLLAGATSWVVRSESALAQLLQRHPDPASRRRAVEVAGRAEVKARARGMLQILKDIESTGLLQ